MFGRRRSSTGSVGSTGSSVRSAGSSVNSAGSSVRSAGSSIRSTQSARSAGSGRSTGSGRLAAIKYRLIDPNGSYKSVRKSITKDCIRQKCVISFKRSEPYVDADPKNNYFGTRITVKLLNNCYSQDCTPENLDDLFPGITEIALHVSEIPTLSVLLVKTETPSPNKERTLDVRYFSSSVDLNGIDCSVFQGLSTKNTFKLNFHEFIYETSEFSFDVELLGPAVLDSHTIYEIPNKKSKAIIQALEFILQVNSMGNDDTIAREKRNKEDVDWFYGQLKKYHTAEKIPRAQVSLQHPHIIPKLRDYQKEAVNWMLYRESAGAGEPELIQMILEKMFVSVKLKRSHKDKEGVPAFFNQYAGYVCRNLPVLTPLPTGGILADEMGLGKTVEVLSLIMLNPNPSIGRKVSQMEFQYTSIKQKRSSSPCEFRTNSKSSASVSSHKKRRLDSGASFEEELSTIKVEVKEENNHEENMELEQDTTEKRGPKVDAIEAETTDKRVTVRLSRKKKQGKKVSYVVTKRKERRNSKAKNKAKTRVESVENKNVQGKLYDKVKPLYDAALGQLSSSKHAVVSHKFHGEFFNPHVGRKAFFECICGAGLENDSENVVTCVTCSSSQHKTCVNFQESVSLFDDYSSAYVCPHCAVQMPPIPTKTTLIVTPNTIAHQWINEIRRHIGKEHLKILYYRGAAVHGYVPPQQLAQYDLIITTYGVLSSELDYVDLPHSNSAEGRRFRNPKRFLPIPSPLPCILFWRICLDEAQMVEGISTRMASMALKLHGVHNWCVTGTPLNKGLEDLYGLFLFLGIAPVNDSFWWYSLVTNPFYQKDASLLYELFGRLIWRNGKRDVLDQLGIPPQHEIVHWLNFSPVETHFYKRLYDVCGARVLEKIQKICKTSQGGLTVRLSNLDRKALHELLAPFLELRQACCHPQLVNHSLTLKNVNETITMDELLTQLIQKTKIKCAEAHRAVVSALNGAAGIHWILEEHVFASDKYREILQLSTKHENLFKTDTLQMLHALENLADLLDMNCPGVPYTLRDDSLRTDAEVLRKKYLENHATGVSSAFAACEKVTKTVDELRSEFKWKGSSWWVEILYEAARKDRMDDLMTRVKDSLEVYASKKDASGSMARRFDGPSSFQHVMIERITDLEKLRAGVLETLQELMGQNPASFVDACIACHLRKYSAGPAPTHDFRCRLCVNLEKFSDYQHALFSEDLGNVKKKISRTGRNRQKLKIRGNLKALTAEEERLTILREQEELVENTGHVEFHKIEHDTKMLGDSDPEKALRQLIAFGRINKLPESILADGATHIKLYDAMKKEFKLLRVLWTRLFDQVSAIDELSQATTRIALRTSTSAAPSSSYIAPKDLANAERERARKIQEINLFSQIELQPRLEDMKQEYESAKADFNVHHGQLVYLEQLEKKNEGKKEVFNQEECPVCHSTLGTKWAVLVCGHSYCSECIKKICHHPAQSFPCPLCRHQMKMSDVSFVDISAQQQEEQPGSSSTTSQGVPETRSVRGSHSTKVQAVVEQLLQLQVTHPGEKVIIFSTWSGVLDIIARALEQNGILFAGLKSGESKGNFQKTLARFQERGDIQVLLLPLISGSKGLNIIEATHVFLVEPILNMASEHQAIGRVHRIGQTKPTYVHRFYVRNTIEEHLFEVLKGHDVSADEEGMLSLGDLKALVTK